MKEDTWFLVRLSKEALQAFNGGKAVDREIQYLLAYRAAQELDMQRADALDAVYVMTEDTIRGCFAEPDEYAPFIERLTGKKKD